jgi:hypothetical protein
MPMDGQNVSNRVKSAQRRTFKKEDKMKKIGIALIVLFVLGIVGLSFLVTRHPTQAHVCVPLAPKPPSNIEVETKVVLGHPLIPGGVKTVKDLRAHVNANPRLKAFYEANGFDFSCVQEKRLERSEWADVTYRRQKDIVWSSHKLLLLAGETVFEDCHGHVIRGVCGNLIASPQIDQITPDIEFSTDLMEPLIPETETQIPGSLPPTDAPPIITPVPPIVTIYEPPPVYGVPCCGGVIVSPPTKTPEVETGELLIAGLAFLVLASLVTHLFTPRHK